MNPFLTSVYQKLASYCAYQERCVQEVRKRLEKYQLSRDETEVVLQKLEVDNFLSESRYAQSFVRGKFRGNGWGRLKIRHALRQKGVSQADIRIGLQEITEEEYEARLQELLDKKAQRLKDELTLLERKQRLVRYAQQKGYEPELIFRFVEACL